MRSKFGKMFCLMNFRLIFNLQVIQRYETEGFQFLLNAFNSPSYLEDLTGLTALHAETLEGEVKSQVFLFKMI